MSSFRVGRLEVDFKRARATRDGKDVPLTARELRLLRYLLERRGRVVSRGELLRQVWEYDDDSETRTVDVHVARLRKKIESDPSEPRILRTARGSGYALEPD